MGVLTRALAAPFKLYNSVSDEVAKERRLRLTDGRAWQAFWGRRSTAGKHVDFSATLQLASAFACIRTNAQAISSLPLQMFEKTPGGSRERVEDDALADVICDSPNRDQTCLEFWETMVGWLMGTGNAYAEITRLGGSIARPGRLTSLQPLPATHCWPHRTAEGELVYRFIDRGKTETLPRDKVFHVRGFGQGLLNRDMGLSPIAAGTNSLGAAMAAQEAAASTFANGMRPSGFFTFDQELTAEQRKQAQANLVEPLQGSSKTGGIGILEAGSDFKTISINPEDAQLLETRRFDVEEICRWFGVPPLVIGHSAEGQTMWGSGVEQILLTWLTLGIDPICDRIEARIRKQLIRPTGNRRQYAEFNREALLAMDSKAKANFLSSMVQNGLMDRNEGRDKLNLPRREGADQLTAQTNLAPLGALGEGDQTNNLRQAMQAFLGLADQPKEDSDDDPRSA